ncbi:MAG: response regulator, partial [Gammaproteobacteria bacterium]|nr:response regulator [Gammaproteobacteria bacterium]
MKKNKIVLYIEDNPVNLDLVVRFLDKYPDISVISCKTAEEGLKLTSNQHPDLVLLDINLPGMSGYEMLD